MLAYTTLVTVCLPSRVTLSGRGNRQLRLASAFGSLGAKGFFGSLGRLLWMLYGPLLVLLLHPPIVFFGPLGAGSALGLFRAFGRLLGVLRPLFAHRASLSARPSTFLLLVVSVTRRCHARDETGGGGRHEEER